MIKITRTTGSSDTFKKLIIELDLELKEQYGDKQDFYNNFNKIEKSKTVVTVKMNNKPAGCGCFKVFTNKGVEIKRMFVTKEFRGLGWHFKENSQ
jgi:putative acetyltransferase